MWESWIGRRGSRGEKLKRAAPRAGRWWGVHRFPPAAVCFFSSSTHKGSAHQYAQYMQTAANTNPDVGWGGTASQLREMDGLDSQYGTIPYDDSGELRGACAFAKISKKKKGLVISEYLAFYFVNHLASSLPSHPTPSTHRHGCGFSFLMYRATHLMCRASPLSPPSSSSQQICAPVCLEVLMAGATWTTRTAMPPRCDHHHTR